MTAMTNAQLRRFAKQTHEVRRALTALRISKLEDEDVRVAIARLEHWLSENLGRWVA